MEWKKMNGEDYDDLKAPTKLLVFDNHIYFNDEVNYASATDLLDSLISTDRWLRAERIERRYPDDFPDVPIWLHICSTGGNLYAAFMIMDTIMTLSSPVYTVAEGLCASAATLFLVSGLKRYIRPNTMLLFHQFSGFMYGTHEQFKDEMILQEDLIDKLVQIYVDRSRLEKDQIRDMLKRDTWLNAQKAVDAGFVHEIMKG